MSASHRCASYGITAGMEWRRKSSTPLSDAHWCIPESHPHMHNCVHFEIYDWNIVCITPVCTLWNHNRDGMTSKIKYRYYVKSANLFGTATPIAQHSVHFEIYDWNSVCITPLASYGITAGTEWRPKLSIPLSHVRRFIRDTPTPIAQRCTFWKYTIGIVSASRRLQAMAS